jgi:hypothetical protein
MRCHNREGSKDDFGSLREEHHRKKELRHRNSAKKRRELLADQWKTFLGLHVSTE